MGDPVVGLVVPAQGAPKPKLVEFDVSTEAEPVESERLNKPVPIKRIRFDERKARVKGDVSRIDLNILIQELIKIRDAKPLPYDAPPHVREKARIDFEGWRDLARRVCDGLKWGGGR